MWEFLNFSLESDILVGLWMSAESVGTKLSPVSYFRIQQEDTSQRHETCLGGTDQLRSTATCCQFVCVNAYIICRPLQMSLKLIAVSLSTDCNCLETGFLSSGDLCFQKSKIESLNWTTQLCSVVADYLYRAFNVVFYQVIWLVVQLNKDKKLLVQF